MCFIIIKKKRKQTFDLETLIWPQMEGILSGKVGLFHFQSLFSSLSSDTLLHFHPKITSLFFGRNKWNPTVRAHKVCVISHIWGLFSHFLFFFWTTDANSNGNATKIQARTLKAPGFRSPCREIWSFRRVTWPLKHEWHFQSNKHALLIHALSLITLYAG